VVIFSTGENLVDKKNSTRISGQNPRFFHRPTQPDSDNDTSRLYPARIRPNGQNPAKVGLIEVVAVAVAAPARKGKECNKVLLRLPPSQLSRSRSFCLSISPTLAGFWPDIIVRCHCQNRVVLAGEKISNFGRISSGCFFCQPDFLWWKKLPPRYLTTSWEFLKTK